MPISAPRASRAIWPRGLISASGSLGAVKVGGDMVEGALIEAATVSSLKLTGALSNSGIDCDSAGTVTIGGGMHGVDSHLRIFGDVKTITVAGGIHASEPAAQAKVSQGWVIDSDVAVDVRGSLGKLAVKGTVDHASILLSYAKAISISKGIDVSLIGAASIGSFAAGGMTDSDVAASTDIGSVTVKGAVSGANITAGSYGGSGVPITGNIGRVSVGSLDDTWITATGSIGPVTSKGVLSDSVVAAVAFDESGAGPNVIGGGNIASLKAAGLRHTTVEANGSIGPVTLGAYGVDYDSAIDAVNGNFAGLKTSGLVSGTVTVGGNLTGRITTAGQEAYYYNGVYYFTDANGTLTDGVLTVYGSVPQAGAVS